MTAIDEIKSRLDIVDLVSETVQLRRSGKNYLGFCPFHSNTRTPAFVVFPDSGTWRCFGQCNEGGDIFRYVMKREGWDFNQTLQMLAERAGVVLAPPTPQQEAEAEEHARLRRLLEDAVTFFRHNLLNTTPGKACHDYLHSRGLNDETIEAFGLGYAPQSWEAVIQFFRKKGYTEAEMNAAGMVTERDGGGYYDRFRHRIIFPIRDGSGKMVGFGGRILNPEDQPKFINSPQTVLFDKSHTLYGLDRARRAIRTWDQAVIVEGYLDVIALHQAGYANAVSPMGTALSEHQLRLLKRFTRRMILALDPDTAGDKATLRGLQVARQALDHETEMVFDARGLLSQEARLQADIRVTTLPQGMDPDDVVRRNPSEWEKIIAEARPVVIHVMETLATGRDLDDPKVKSEIAGQVLPLVEDVPDPVEREAYRQRLARLLRVDERALLGEVRGRSPQSRRGRTRITQGGQKADDLVVTDAATATSQSARHTMETHCLGILLRRPDLVFRIDRTLQEAGLTRLSMIDFERSEHQTIFSLIQGSLEQDAAEPLNFVLNHLSLPLMDEADKLLAQTEKMDPNDERVLEDVMRTLLEMRLRGLHQGIDHTRYLMEEAQQAGDMLARDFLQNMRMYAEALRLVHKAIGHYTERVVASS